MRVTFIQPYYHNVWEALGLGYIISFLKQNYRGHLDIHFFQGYFDKDDIDIISTASESDIVFFSCTSPTYRHGLELARGICMLNSNIHIVFGGWHPTAVPDDVIKEGCIDQVVVGEGETAVVRIVEGERTPVIRGLSVHPRNVPRPDREVIRNDRTVDLCESMNGRRTASFQLNRGCKVHCKYCAEITMTGKYNSRTNPIRSLGVGVCLDEIAQVTEDYNLNYFKFVDATFDRDIELMHNFCLGKYLHGNTTPWECNIHPGLVQDESVFRLLEWSNCKQINVGCESGSQTILNDIGKGTRVKHIKNVFKWAKDHGIERRAYFILGMPNETWVDHSMTRDLIDEIEPDHVGFTILCPYPGTDFYDPKKHRHINWSKTDEYSNDFWEGKFYSNDKLKHLQEYFVHRYKNQLCERQK